MRRAPTRDDVPTPLSEIDSGAHTFILSGGEGPRPAGPQDHGSIETTTVLDPAHQDGRGAAPPTSAIHGSEVNETGQGSATTNLKQTRITAPVEGETTTPVRRDDWFQGTSPIAGEKTSAVPPSADSLGGQATVALGADSSIGGAQPPTQTIDFVAVTPPAQQPRATPPPPVQPAAQTRVDGGVPAFPGAVPQWDQPPARPQAPAADKKSVVKIVSVLVAVAVIGAAVFGLWWYAVGGNKPRQSPAPRQIETPVAQPTPPSKPPAPPAPPEGMVRVDGGTLTIGRNAGDPLEQPAHKAEVEAFFIDRTEVTNADYKKFLDATGHPAPPTRESGWTNGQYPAGEEKFPVVGVTWQDASTYAEWAGKRLPTEVEWEAAARGSDARIYPWGNQWKAGVANIGSSTGKPVEVGTYTDGASPSGALDMVGNVWEWTADEISVYSGSKGVIETEPGVTYRVIRGGAFDGDRRHDASYRGYQDASKPYPKIGFRCAKSAK